MREGQQRVGLDRERPRGGLHEPASTDAAYLRGERRAARRRDVLDHARAVHELELAVGERQPRGGVGLDERAGIFRARGEIDACDVQLGLQRAQSDPPAANVQHPRAGGQMCEREEMLMALGPRARGQR